MTHTVCFGSGVVTPGLGFLYNDGMCMFDRRPGQPNSIAPGKRPVSGGGPALLFEDDAVRLALGSPHGGRKISSMAHVLVSLREFGLSPAAAVASPRVHCEHDARELRVDPFLPLRRATRSRNSATTCRRTPMAAGCASSPWTRRRAGPAVHRTRGAAAAWPSCSCGRVVDNARLASID
jgi:gamma-glutamyltranspeptidase